MNNKSFIFLNNYDIFKKYCIIYEVLLLLRLLIHQKKLSISGNSLINNSMIRNKHRYRRQQKKWVKN